MIVYIISLRRERPSPIHYIAVRIGGKSIEICFIIDGRVFGTTVDISLGRKIARIRNTGNKARQNQDEKAVKSAFVHFFPPFAGFLW